MIWWNDPQCMKTRRNSGWDGGARFSVPAGLHAEHETLSEDIRLSGFHIRGCEWFLYNPRGLSTLIFLALRWVFGRHADPVIGVVLDLFNLLSHLPTRRCNARFMAVAAVSG